MPEDEEPLFKSDFLWGASIAAYQVEGGNHNQWTEWEKANAEKLASSAEERLSKLPLWEEEAKQAQKPETYISGPAVDHYNRYEQDFDLLKQLNLNTLRFSIEWSRLEPEEGRWNEDEIEHYRLYIAALKERSIEPVINIWHWTNPSWFEARGGFKKRRNLRYFERFVKKLAELYLADIRYVVTINEPNTYTYASYADKDLSSGYPWPPGDRNLISATRVYLNLLTAHKRAYKILKKHHSHLQIGTAQHVDNIQAKNPHNFMDELSTRFMRYVWNWWFMHRIRHHQDFVGLNYYDTDYYTGFLKKLDPKLPLNDLGWYMEPEGLYPLLLRAWAHYHKPIIVTENGVADAKDEYRRWWIEETIIAIERAMSEGVKVQGYFHWSLLDNFEWTNGWLAKFGLIEVVREHGMQRIIRPSAKWYADRIAKLTINK